MAHHLTIAHRIEHGNAHVLAQQFDDACSDVQRFAHDHRKDAHDIGIVHGDQPLNQTANALPIGIAAGDCGRLGIQAKQGQNLASPGIEQTSDRQPSTLSATASVGDF
ncbi:hypothetical protein [Novosphingobium resinovorum]|jgi:hypothetical protein|uniref:hypothetical protein n=1 Tax=Novosphingobium resinovorum TaxID=158500 RepID=UPI00068AB69D|nr:hypothetical protein [Novosphingobium resinovorum]